ncbi:MAG: DUF4430 domain-containing protein [Ruminococcaceae bacterium]|nr:DUF4430 domain-containing protein [Oscillospiraceae bacterium]
MKKNKNIVLVIGVLLIAFCILIFLHTNPVEQKEYTEELSSMEISLQEDEKETEKVEQDFKLPTDEPTHICAAQEENDTFSENEIKPIFTPEPGEESDERDVEKTLTCSLSIRCDAVIENPELLTESKQSIIPEDGIILSLPKVIFNEGESVFDVLLRELKNAQIHFEFEKTPMYDSAYIKGIGNLYEFDCGDCSGWLYKVNGVTPTHGCSQYKIKKDDEIEFFYSCNYFEKT